MLEVKLKSVDSKELKELHAELFEEFNRLEQNRWFIERQWEINYLSCFTKEKYVLKMDGAIVRLSSADDAKKYYSRSNNLFKVYRNTLSKIHNALPLMQINQTDPESVNEYGAELAEALIVKEQKEMKKRGVIARTMSDFVWCGNAFTKQYFNKDKGAFKAIDDQGNKIKEGECEIRHKSPFQLLFDPTAYNISYAAKVFETWFIPTKVFEKLFPKYKAEDVSGFGIDNSIKNKILLSGDFLNIDKRIQVKEYVKLIKVYIEPNITNHPILKDGGTILMTPTDILEVQIAGKEEPFINPFSQAKRIETGTAYGETPISYSVPIDRELALVRGQLAEHSEKLSSPMLIMNHNSTIESKKIGNRFVKVIYYNEKYGKPEFIQPAEFSQYFHVNMQKLEQDLSDVNALHDSSYGKREQGTRSGLQQAYMVSSDDSQHMPDVSAYYAMFEDAGGKYLSNIKDKHSEDRTVAIFGLDNIKYMKYTGAQLKNNTSIEVQVVAGLPLDRAQRQQAVIQLATLNALPKSSLLKILDLGELSTLYKAGMKDRIRQIMEFDKLDAGKEVIPNIEDDDIIHIQECFDHFKTSKFLELSDEKKLVGYKHAVMHRDQMVKMFKEFPIAAFIKCKVGTMDEAMMSAVQLEIKRYEMELVKKNPPTVPTPLPTVSGAPSGGSDTGATPEEQQGNMAAAGAIPPQQAGMQAQLEQNGGQ